MQLLVGIALLVGGIVALMAASPRKGIPRFFVGTGLEAPIAITLVVTIGIGFVLTIGGVAGMFQ
jgi:hypothetical protein